MTPESNGRIGLLASVLGILIPSLRGGYSQDAAETLRLMAREARRSGPMAFLSFFWREAKDLVHASFVERRIRRGEKKRRRIEGRHLGEPGGPGLSTVPGKTGGRGGDPDRGSGGWARTFDSLMQDLRYGARSLAKTPGFIVVTVLSLTFGIALSSVLFSIVNAVFIRPLPYAAHPEELVRVFSSSGGPSQGPISYPEYLDIQRATETLENVAVERNANFYVGSAAEASRRVLGQEVSENYFDVLGISMARGRGFLKEDVDLGQNVAVIGYNLWQRRFAGDPGVLGQELLVDGKPYTVVGVLPRGMVGLDSPALLEVVIPAGAEREQRGHMSFTGLGRLAEGATLDQVRAELEVIAGQMAQAYPEYWAGGGGSQRGLGVLTRQESMIPNDATFWLAMVGFLVAVGLILLITCSNVANLLLIRAFKRRGEIAVRAAVGARSRRILAQLLVENLLLFGLAGITSLLVLRVFMALVSGGMSFLPPMGANFDLDWRVVGFTFGLSLLAGLTFGLLPAAQASRLDLVPALKGRLAPQRFKRFGVRNLLVGVQVGGSAVFVMATLFLVQSLAHARHLDLGFDPEGIAVLSVNLEHGGYQEEDGRQFLSALTARLSGLVGVEGAEVSTWIPLEGGGSYLGGLEPEGYDSGGGSLAQAGMTMVSPGYLDLVRASLLRGRPLLPEDVAGGEMVALASQAFVDRYWPGESGVGKWIGRGERPPIRVVGVVKDIPMVSLAEEVGPQLWLPLSQWYDPDVIVHVRTTGDPRALLPALRRQVAELDPDLPVLRVDLMESVTANGTLPQRILSLALGIAGAVALGLAMLGIYGVVAFYVGQRTREVGVRMALGAEPGQVVRMVIREGLGVAAVGLVPGFLLSLAAAQLMRTFLLGVDPMNPLGYAAGVGLLAFSVVAATIAPAFRAARAHPMESLRTD